MSVLEGGYGSRTGGRQGWSGHDDQRDTQGKTKHMCQGVSMPIKYLFDFKGCL